MKTNKKKIKKEGFYVDWRDLRKTIDDLPSLVKKNSLKEKIEEYLTPEVGQAIVDGVDLIMRLRLGQLTIVCDILKRNCSLYEEGKGPGLDSSLYKALELGEYLKCLKDNPDCEHAKDCWITRKGLAPCRNKRRGSKK